MRLEEIANSLFLVMARVLKALGRSLVGGGRGAASRVFPDPTFVPDPGPDERKDAQEATPPEAGGTRHTGPPPDWLRRTQQGVPEHWFAVVRKHAPQLLGPAADRDDRARAMHCVMGADGLEPMGAFKRQPDQNPEDTKATQRLPAECQDQESDAIHPGKGVNLKLRESTSRPSGRSLGDRSQPVHRQECMPRISERPSHSRAACIEPSTDSPDSTERLENGVVPVRGRETVPARPEAERLARAAAGEPEEEMRDRGSAAPPGLVKIVEEDRFAKAKHCPSRTVVRTQDAAERGNGLSRDPGKKASLKPQSEPVPQAETTSHGLPCTYPTSWMSVEDPALCGKTGYRTAGSKLPAHPSESSRVTDERAVQRALPAPCVSDPEGSPQGWEDLLESLALSSSPRFPAEPSARRWPELMEERGMDFHDHRAAFDERERRERLMREQDGTLWSA
jgi:hypothetical protein